MDFTLSAYKQLISTLQPQCYFFQTFEEYIQNPKGKVVILRHDVDRKPGNALKMARLEDEMGIRATYFFRTIPHTFKPEIMKEIAGLGHEIGYHYENLSDPQITQINADEGERGKREEELVIRKENRGNRNEEKGKGKGQRGKGKEEIGISKQETVEKEREGREWKRGKRIEKLVIRKENRGNRIEERGIRKEEFGDELFELAIDDFRLNLEKLRTLYPVKTICMHGSPLSKWDNRDLWKKYDYKDFGIIVEPYFDVDFDEVFYLTDTGRRWDGDAFNIRDKVGEEREKWKQDRENRNEELGIRKKTMNEKLGLRFRSTWDIIEAAERGLLPDKIMLNIHPQRWDDRFGPWVKELFWQNVKNAVKRYMIKLRDLGI